jgi:hypothetical protein
MLLNKTPTAWEHRIGSFRATCTHCRQEQWQLLYRLYHTEGSTMSPATPYGFVVGVERFQVRCSTCFGATSAGHPSTWAPQMGPGFVNENFPATAANPQYLRMAFASY